MNCASADHLSVGPPSVHALVRAIHFVHGDRGVKLTAASPQGLVRVFARVGVGETTLGLGMSCKEVGRLEGAGGKLLCFGQAKRVRSGSGRDAGGAKRCVLLFELGLPVPYPIS